MKKYSSVLALVAFLTLSMSLNAHDYSSSSSFKPVAFVATNLPSNSAAVPLVNDEQITFASITTNNRGIFQLVCNGTLVLNADGLYSIVGNFNYQNTIATTGLVGVYAALNGQSLAGSPIFRNIGGLQTSPLVSQVSFYARKGDELTWKHSIAPGSSFAQPSGPMAQGFVGGITQTDWEAFQYYISFDGPSRR